MKPEELEKAERILNQTGWLYGVEPFKTGAVIVVISHNKQVVLRTDCLQTLRRWLTNRRKKELVEFKKKARENRFLKRCDW